MKVALGELAGQQLAAAHAATSQRAAKALLGGHERALRHTLIALVAGAVLAEHENPGEASLYVISGQVELRSTAGTLLADAGDLVEIPPLRHSVAACADAVVLLTTVVRSPLPVS